jgi:putative hemolysin
MPTKFIDIEKVIRNKNPRLLKTLPRFIISYLKRIIHQDEINEVIKVSEHLEGPEFIKNVLNIMGIRYKVFGMKNIPDKGRFIFAANHPLGGLDGLVFIQEVGKLFPNVKFPVNDLLLNIKNLNNIFLPINKHGVQAKESAKLIEEAYASDVQILYFPAGLCSRKQKGEIKDLEWKKNFVAKAIKHKRDIIPVHFSGRNSNFFYNLANFREFIGIKSNFEMVYLPDEMFKQKGKSLTMTYGKPISFQTLSNSELSAQEWSDRLRNLVHDM